MQKRSHCLGIYFLTVCSVFLGKRRDVSTLENNFVVGEIFNGEGQLDIFAYGFHAYLWEFSKKIEAMPKKWISERKSGG